MNAPNTYVISLPQEAQGLLAENRMDLVDTLRTDGLDVKRGSLPAGAPAPEGGKEVIITLVAIGLTASIKILDALGRNQKFLVTEHELAPVLDRTGKPVKNAAGEPVMYWLEKKRLVEATQVTQDKSTVSGEISPTMVKFSVSSGK
jgi:hypothetical protein